MSLLPSTSPVQDRKSPHAYLFNPGVNDIVRPSADRKVESVRAKSPLAPLASLTPSTDAAAPSPVSALPPRSPALGMMKPIASSASSESLDMARSGASCTPG